jgi:hypothetical protein
LYSYIQLLLILKYDLFGALQISISTPKKGSSEPGPYYGRYSPTVEGSSVEMAADLNQRALRNLQVYSYIQFLLLSRYNKPGPPQISNSKRKKHISEQEPPLRELQLQQRAVL